MPSPIAGRRVAVLGAGPMGLAVAYQLARDGHVPVVFEADDRIGGMAASFDFGGIRIERYYHFHCTSDHDLFNLLAELGLESRLHWVHTKMGYFYLGQVQRWGDPFALLAFKGLGLVDKIRYGLHAFVSSKRDDWRALDALEATGWIKKWVGQRAFDVLWKQLFELKFYEYAYGLSAAWIWSRIRRIGRSRYSIFKEKLGYLEGGSDLVLNGMRDVIESKGGMIRLSAPVSRVAIEGGKVVGVEVAGAVEPFDTVISTVPMPFVPRLVPDLPAEIREQYGALRNIAVVCVIAKLRRAVTGNFWLNVNDPEMDIPGLVEYTNLRSLDAHVVYVPFYMPGEHPKFRDPDAVFVEKVRRYIQRINPEVADDDFLEIRASRYRYAQPICTPGFASRLPPIRLPVDGLFVADTSFYYPEDRGISESVGLGRRMARMAVDP